MRAVNIYIYTQSTLCQ